MYIDDEQGFLIDAPVPGVATPLASTVVKHDFAPATFEPSGKLTPSNKRELDQFSDPEDFDNGDVSTWTVGQWVTIAPGRHYRWNNPAGPVAEWVVAPLGPWDGFDGITNEGYFDGRWPQTKKELDTIDPGSAFAVGKFICLVGRDIGVQYFWDGDKWVEGVAS